MFVGSQQRITFGNIHYYVDMVFTIRYSRHIF
jgi:predicted nuclease of restriction endonuclease-like (RecB) superfamily